MADLLRYTLTHLSSSTVWTNLQRLYYISRDDYFKTYQRESGYKILSPIPELESVAITTFTHHERFDGNGYPNSIAGDKIPLHARIICVADSFSAMISERHYRERFSYEEARQEIVNCFGNQFDPMVVDAFINRFSRICTEIERI